MSLIAAKGGHRVDSRSTARRKITSCQQTVDARYKGLFSEEMAIGMMATVLKQRLGIIRINNFAKAAKPGTLNRKLPMPDFIALGGTGAGFSLLVESKGGLRQRINARRSKRAKEQIKNLTIGGTTATAGLVCSGVIYYEGQKRLSCLSIEDPPPDVPEVTELDETLAWRTAYARLLRFIGLDTASAHVHLSLPAVTLPSMTDDEFEQIGEHPTQMDASTRRDAR